MLYQYLDNYRIVQDGTDMIYKQMLNISIINKSNECCIPKCTLRSAIARSDLHLNNIYTLGHGRFGCLDISRKSALCKQLLKRIYLNDPDFISVLGTSAGENIGGCCWTMQRPVRRLPHIADRN